MRYLLILFTLWCCTQVAAQNYPTKAELAFADSVVDGYNNIKRHNFSKEEEGAKRAYQTYLAANDSCRAIRAASLLSIAYDAQGKLDTGLTLMLNAQKLFNGKCGGFIHANYILNLTNLYLSYDDPVKVMELCEAELTAWKDHNYIPTYFGLLTNCAISFAYQGKLKEAVEVFHKIRVESSLHDKVDDEIDANLNLGSLYGMLNSMDSCYYYLNKAYELCVQSNCQSLVSITSNMASYLSDAGRFKEAINWFEKGKALAKEEKDLQILVALTRNEAFCQFNMGNTQVAWDLINEHIQLKDSLLNVEKVNALAEIGERYENEKRLRKIKELEVENLDVKLKQEKTSRNLGMALTAGLGFLIVAAGLWNRLNFVRRSRTALQKEKDRSEALLLNILPREVAEELKEKGESEAKDFDNVTVLFTDFVEFTQTAEKLSAKELVGEINMCFKAFDEILQKYQIEKIKTIGDAYMAAGGLHVPRVSEPRDVVKAALEMQQFMLSRKAAREAQNQPAFDMRVGIHTGPVVAGIVGVKKFQYDIWGDTVNTASRMESNGQVGKVNISHATYELIKDDTQFTFESRGKVAVKGKGEMEMWFVEMVG